MAFSLETLRKHHKVVFWVLVFLIVPSFCLFGFGSSLDKLFEPESRAYIGEYSGRKVPVLDYVHDTYAVGTLVSVGQQREPQGDPQVMSQIPQMLLLFTGALQYVGVPDEQGRLAGYRLDSSNMGRKSSLMFEALAEKAYQMDLGCTSEEVTAFVKAHPILDENIVKVVSSRRENGLNKSAFMNAVGKIMSIKKLEDHLNSASIVTWNDLDEKYHKQNDKMKVGYKLVDVKAKIDDVNKEYGEDQLSKTDLTKEKLAELEKQFKDIRAKLDVEIKEYYDKAAKEYEDEEAKIIADKEAKEKEKRQTRDDQPFYFEKDAKEKDKKADDDPIKLKDKPKMYRPAHLKLEYLLATYDENLAAGISSAKIAENYSANRYEKYRRKDLPVAGPSMSELRVVNVDVPRPGAKPPKAAPKTKDVTFTPERELSLDEIRSLATDKVEKIPMAAGQNYFQPMEMVKDKIIAEETEKVRAELMVKLKEYVEKQVVTGFSTNANISTLKFNLEKADKAKDKPKELKLQIGYIEGVNIEEADKTTDPVLGKVKFDKFQVKSKYDGYLGDLEDQKANPDITIPETTWGSIECDKGYLLARLDSHEPKRVLTLAEATKDIRKYLLTQKGYARAKEDAQKLAKEMKEKGYNKNELKIRGEENRSVPEPKENTSETKVADVFDSYQSRTDQVAEACFEQKLKEGQVGEPVFVSDKYYVPVVLEEKMAIGAFSTEEIKQNRQSVKQDKNMDLFKSWLTRFNNDIKLKTFNNAGETETE